MTPQAREKLRWRATRWARYRARKFPGVQFIALYDGSQISYETVNGKVRRIL